MKFIRKIMQDRSSAGAIAMLALLLFLLQGLANGVAHGSMAAMALAADDVICSSHLPAAGAGKQDRDPAGKTADTCCGTLCRLASASAVALLVTPAEPAGNITRQIEGTFLRPETALPPAPPNRESQPRAPPLTPQF